MTTRSEARHALERLGPAPAFLQAYDGPRLPEGLDLYVGCPEEFFLAPDTLPAYTEGRLVPILDDGQFSLITFYDPATGGLVQQDVETPGEVRASFAHWGQFLADLLIRIAESVEDDDRLRRMARLIGFDHVDELIRFLDSGRDRPSPDEFDRRRARFIAALKP